VPFACGTHRNLDGSGKLVNSLLRPAAIFSCLIVLVAGAWGATRLLYDRPAAQPTLLPASPLKAPPPSLVAPLDAPAADATKSNANTLSEADRKLIWDIEHIALLLDVHIFPKLARAIRDRDAAVFREILSDEFEGRVPQMDDAKPTDFAFGQFRTLSGAKEAGRATNAEQFVAFLLGERSVFREPPKVEMRLMRLSPVNRAALNGNWHGTTKIRMAGELEGGEPFELELQGHFSFAAPADDFEQSRHWLKACVLDTARVNAATRFLMKEVAAERGIDRRRFHDNWDNPDKDPLVARGGVQVCDFNRDGWLDVLITDDNEAALFQGGPGGTFHDVTAAAGLAGNIQSAAGPAIFADFDGDGYEDLLIGPQLFRNNRDATFTDITLLANFRLPPDAGGYSVADYDLDGRVDLYVVRSSRGPAGQSRVSWVDDQSGPGNQLWRNVGGWQFRNVTSYANASAGFRSSFSAVWLDANGDGRPDLAVADEFGSSVLLVNELDGRFTERPLKLPFAGFCMGIVAGDFDNDGKPDLYLANMYSKAGDRIIANLPENAYTPEVRAKIKDFVNGSELLRNKGDLTFESIGKSMGVHGVGWAYGPCMVDLNNDGWLDLYATAGFLSYTRGEPDG
jgi:hypothetical protein